MKRSRVDLTREQLSIMESAWQDGLKTTNKKRKPSNTFQNLSEITGLSQAKIDQWIGNRRAKDRRTGQSVKECVPNKASKAKRIQGPNGYSLFVQGFKRGTKPKGEYLKEVGERWHQLRPEEKKSFSERAAHIRQTPSLGMSREKLISRHLGIMNESCKFLSSIEVYAGGFVVDSQDPDATVQFGPPKVVKLLEPTLQSFKQEVLVQCSSVQENDYRRNELKKIVQAKFNSAWNKASKGKGKVPYTKLHEKKVQVICRSLPVGVEFKNPSKYSLNVLQAIADRPDIHLQILNKQADISALNVTLSGPSYTTSAPGPSHALSGPGPSYTTSAPGPSHALSGPGPSYTASAPGPSHALSGPGPSHALSGPGPSHALSGPGPSYTTSAPGPSHALSGPGPSHALSGPGPSYTTSAPGPSHALSGPGPSHALSGPGPSHALSGPGPSYTTSAPGPSHALSGPGPSYTTSAPGPSHALSGPGPSYTASAPGPSHALSGPGPSHALSGPGPSYTTSAPGPSHALSAPGPSHALSGPGPSHALSGPGPSYTTSAPGPSHALSGPGPSHALSGPGPSHALSGPGPSYTTSAPGPSHALSGPGPSYTTSAPGPSHALSGPGPSYTTSAPGPSHALSGPGPSHALSGPGPSYTTSAPGPSYTTSAPGPSHALSAPGPSHALSGPGPSHALSGPGPSMTSVAASYTNASSQDASSILAQLSMGGHGLVEMAHSDLEESRSIEEVLSLHQTSADHKGKSRQKRKRKSRGTGAHNSKEEVEDSKLYRVERVLRTKYKKSLVKWEGFDAPSWELTKNIIQI